MVKHIEKMYITHSLKEIQSKFIMTARNAIGNVAFFGKQFDIEVLEKGTKGHIDLMIHRILTSLYAMTIHLKHIQS